MSKKSKEELEEINFNTPSPEKRFIQELETDYPDEITIIPQPRVTQFTNVKNWRSQFNRGNYNGEKGETKPSQQPSQTIPDQTLSIREIVYRHSIGAPINASQRVPIYEEEGQLITPDFKRMDLAEIQEYKEQLQTAIKEQQRINAEIEQKNQYNKEIAKAEYLLKQREEKLKQKQEKEAQQSNSEANNKT